MVNCAENYNTDLLLYLKRNRTIKVTILKPDDISGAKIWFSVKRYITDPDSEAVISKKSANNGGNDGQAKIVSGVDGIIEVYISKSDTASLSVGEYVWDLVIETSAGKTLQIVEPSLIVLAMPVSQT